MSDKRRYYTRLPAVGPDDDSLPMPGDGFEAHASERGAGDTGFFSGDGFGDGFGLTHRRSWWRLFPMSNTVRIFMALYVIVASVVLQVMLQFHIRPDARIQAREGSLFVATRVLIGFVTTLAVVHLIHPIIGGRP